jgi:hypothetical protein
VPQMSNCISIDWFFPFPFGQSGSDGEDVGYAAYDALPCDDLSGFDQLPDSDMLDEDDNNSNTDELNHPSHLGDAEDNDDISFFPDDFPRHAIGSSSTNGTHAADYPVLQFLSLEEAAEQGSETNGTGRSGSGSGGQNAVNGIGTSSGASRPTLTSNAGDTVPRDWKMSQGQQAPLSQSFFFLLYLITLLYSHTFTRI